MKTSFCRFTAFSSGLPQRGRIVTGSGLAIALLLASCTVACGQAVEIGSRRELFVDKLLIDRLDGVELRLHTPVAAPRAASPLPERHYFTVIRDGEVYRAYWRDTDPDYQGRFYTGHPGEIVCYAESRDGREWTFPQLGLHEVGGTKQNNVILANLPPLLTNFTPFLDTRSGVPQAERYKALAGYPGEGDKRGKAARGMGLVAFYSADGIHWEKQGEVIRYQPEWRHAFDSQNVSFWSEAEQHYVCYFRTWTVPDRLRSVSRTTSPDFKQWSKPVAMHPNRPGEHLYTNQTHPYFRAPHIYIALPTRFVPGRGDAPGYAPKDVNATDIVLMSSRAGSERYDRLFASGFLRPGLDPARWRNRSNYVALNVVPTGPDEMSIYHRSGDRYVLRTDGFVSVHAGAERGELITRPLVFAGSALQVNLSTSAAGSLRVEIQDETGRSLPGFSLADSNIVYGDAIDMPVAWKTGHSLSSLAGRPVRLRFVLEDADLYSFQFDSTFEANDAR